VLAGSETRLDALMRARDVYFGDRLIPSFELPFLVPVETLCAWAARAERLVAAAEAVARAALEDAELLDAIGLDRRAEELARIDPGYARIAALARPDALVTANGPVFIEINCDCPAFMTYGDVIADCLLELPSLDPVRERLAPESRTARLLDALLDCYRDFGGAVWPPRIAVAEWDWRDARFEAQMISERFSAAGYPTVTCDPRAFRRAGAELQVGGRPVHMVYRRVSVREMVANRADIEPLLTAYRERLICMVNPLRSCLAGSKAVLAILCGAAGERFWGSSPPRELIAATTVLTPALARGLERRMPRHVLKRADSSSGEHVLLPGDAGWRDALDRARREVWVAQEHYAAPTLDVPRAGVAPESLFYTWNPFVFGERYGGSVVFAGRSPLVNPNKTAGVMPTMPHR
jgi:hypothetical protein